MSIFAKENQHTIPLPFDPPHTITITKCTGDEITQAQAEHIRSLVAGRSARGWAEQFQRQIGKGIIEVKELIFDPMNGYERKALIKAGLVGWSYDRDITDEVIASLDDDAQEFIAREILQLSKPGLFVRSVDEAKDARKNDSSVSTAA